ncbi:hypothetical protein P12x_005985 (plasmid) [Tundrisphaera lichenicola]|uniref:hypothetical protein n=1 Tax=Tundrisphaera lichenicola TaxID=2029860 RepID=UPI003EBDA98C
MADEMTARRLIWVPIIHTPEDMGRLKGAVQAAHARGRGGRSGWEAYARAASDFWQEARRLVEGFPVDFAKVRLYQDALPACGYEEKIVRELAHAGGANYRLLVDLMARGAILTGTESPQLLVREYELARETLAGKAPADHAERAAALLEERDRFIAQRIAETLRSDEIGLIFLGRAHSLEGRWPEGIVLERLDPVKASP